MFFPCFPERLCDCTQLPVARGAFVIGCSFSCSFFLSFFLSFWVARSSSLAVDRRGHHPVQARMPWQADRGWPEAASTPCLRRRMNMAELRMKSLTWSTDRCVVCRIRVSSKRSTTPLLSIQASIRCLALYLMSRSEQTRINKQARCNSEARPLQLFVYSCPCALHRLPGKA